MNKPILKKNYGLTKGIETFHNCRKEILRAPEVTNPKTLSEPKDALA